MRDNFHEEELDQALNSASQARIRKAVQSLPDETLSLAWRSALNDKLQAKLARRRKAALFAWVWKPAVGVALATVLAIPFVAREPATPYIRPDVEKALVNNYVEDATSWDVAADGITIGEEREAPMQRQPFELDPEDVGATL